MMQHAFGTSPRTGDEARGVFALRASLKTEMSRFRTLRLRDKDQAAFEMKRGAVMVGLARDGQLKKLRDMVGDKSPWYWFTVHMFTEAAVNARLGVIDYMVENGAPIDQHPLRDILTVVAERASPDDAVKATTHLVTSVGFLASHQRCGDWLSPLHVACQTANFALAERLVNLGADVNAVAKDDIMPLHCADRASDPEPFYTLLLDRGARRAWRRDPKIPDPPEGAYVLSTS
ncbi:hypothetical protein CTAYLR_006261 [Chrysophaeum taylorii]|uniref:Ankyrin repeat domain-containing protein n=1 Tax=Chrysophaeum taylorii TaxID=2483200 RepID=A0AAD7ULP5_9STRA|nr:hypothetical protein CTAYLR_006261 [Chrysophaeum taylorii]